MKQQTIYFLQALWDSGIQREKLEKIAKEASLYEINHFLRGVLDEQTLWVSEQSKCLKRKVDTIRKTIEQLTYPYQLIDINKEYQKLIGEIYALQIKTVKTLNLKAVLIFEDIHIIVKQLFPFVLKKIREQTYFQLYRLLILNGRLPAMELCLPTGNSLKEWIYFYQNKLMPMFEQLNDETLDGRWAYEKKCVTLNNKIRIEQFIAEKPDHEDLKTGIGKPQVGTGEKGHLRVYGRGYMTNLSPWDLANNMKITYNKELTLIKDFSFIKDESDNPVKILDIVFGQEKYVVAPEKYFELMNRYIIVNTFYQRMQLGICLYCGSPLYHGKCPKCEWKE